MKRACLLGILLSLGACQKADQEPRIELPPATQAGKNVGGCLIDGEVWKAAPSSGLFGSATGMFALVNKKTGQNTYVISIGLSSETPSRGISVQCRKATGVGVYPFELKVPSYVSPLPEPDYAQYRNSNGKGPRGTFITGPTATGQLEITYFDLQNKIIEGRFAFTGQDSLSLGIVAISDGRFDATFSYIQYP